MATFTNQATLSYNDTTVNSNIVTGTIVEVLAITKTAVTDRYALGEDVTYIVSLTNSGATPLTGVTVTDNLGGGTQAPLDYQDGSILYYQNGVLQATPTVTATSPLTVTGITVPAGGNAMLIYEATANSFAPLAAGSTIQNTATATAGTTSVTATETVTVVSAPALSIIKALSPSVITENSTVTYTFTLQNSGNVAATVTDNVVVTDTFNPILSDITVTLNGDSLPPTAYTYDEATGLFTTTAGTITVPAATFTQDPQTGVITATPGITTLTVPGTI